MFYFGYYNGFPYFAKHVGDTKFGKTFHFFTIGMCKGTHEESTIKELNKSPESHLDFLSPVDENVLAYWYVSLDDLEDEYNYNY